MSPDRGAVNNDPKKRALHNTLRRKQRSDVPLVTPTQVQQPGDPVRRGNTLVRRRRSNPATASNPVTVATTRKTEVPRETRVSAVKQPHKPQPVKARRHSHNQEHHEPAPTDTRDTSDVWIRRTIKDRLSLSSVNPRLLLSGIKPPHLLQVLTGHVKPKEEPRPPPPPPPAQSKRPHRHRHHEHRHRHRSTGEAHKRPVPPIPMPTPAVANADAGAEVREHRHRHRTTGGAQKRPVPPIPVRKSVVADAGASARVHEQQEPLLSATPLLEPIAYSMPTPTHIIIPSEIMQQTSQDADLQLCEVSPVELPQQGTNPVHDGQASLVATRAVPLVYADRKHRLSTASGDDDSHIVRVYKVLGRVNSTLDSGTNVAQSPMLVTVSRNGSITSEVSLMPRRSEENGSSIFQSAAASVLPSLRSPPISSLISKQRTNDGSRTRSPGQQTASTGGATSQGEESYTTARLYTGTMSPKDFMAKSQPDSGAMADKSMGADNTRTRRDSDVSDIAMRNHLVIGDDHANLERSRPSSIHSGYELPATANRTFSEWLRTQTGADKITSENQVPDTSATIAQTVARSPSAGPAAHSSSDSSPHVPGQFPQSYQRHYYPQVTRASYTAPNEESQALNLLQARVSDLETRFTCMEALLASVEDELSELAVTPRTLSRLRRAVSATRLPAGMRPVVGAVTLAPSVAGLQSQTDLASSPVLSTACGRSDDASSEVDREDTVVAVQTTAAALAELVGKSRREFDEATNSALSSISALVNGMQTMRRLDKNLADTADAELFTSSTSD
ncbi:hypothetical protein H4R27_004039 [Coemansia aciculifera]|nr:hypothetical protein H4R27_004039 [Coemansia aciculifera]